MGELVYLWGREHTLPPLVTTMDLLNLCEQPTITATCVSLVHRAGFEQPCGGLLAYQAGAWHHVNACLDCYDSEVPCPGDLGHRSCGDPEPRVCAHDCTDPADIEVQCVNGAVGECDGCCWVRNDELEGRRMWAR